MITFLVTPGSAKDIMYRMPSQTYALSHTPVASRMQSSENCTNATSASQAGSAYGFPGLQLGGSRRSPPGYGPIRDEIGVRPASTSITCAPCDCRLARLAKPACA